MKRRVRAMARRVVLGRVERVDLGLCVGVGDEEEVEVRGGEDMVG